MNDNLNHDDTPVRPQLKQDEIHLWCCDDTRIKDAVLLRHYSTWLDDVELGRLERFHFAEHRHQFLVSHALLRFALSSYHSSLGPADWQFSTNDYGRPMVANRRMAGNNPVFSLSHTRGLVVLAICRSGELGVDVEFCRQFGDAARLSDQFFSAGESRDLNSLPESQQGQRYFDYWTLKEAYMKARGLGFAIPLRSFSFDLSLPGKIGFSVEPGAGDRKEGWQFWQTRPNTTHRIAVAHRTDEVPQRIKLRYFKAVPDVSIKPVNYAVVASSR